MTLVTRDPATGMRRGGIRWPHGTVPPPSGCRWCGWERRTHAQTWTGSASWHIWARPTQAQILARMLARRRLAGRPAIECCAACGVSCLRDVTVSWIEDGRWLCETCQDAEDAAALEAFLTSGWRDRQPDL
jgi:hypothetical protein